MNEMVTDTQRHTTEIVSAYVSKNPIPSDQLPALIQTVYASLTKLGEPVAPVQAERPQPAVSVRKSVQPDYLVCLEDGKKMKMLKRHLRSTYNMSPEQYRERWGLPHDYPMVAPNYAKQRSALAKEIGLGTNGRSRTPAAALPAPTKSNGKGDGGESTTKRTSRSRAKQNEAAGAPA